MGAREWILTAAVILVPLFIAVIVTLWSLKQVRYRRKEWKPPSPPMEGVGGDSGRRSPTVDDVAAP